MDQLLAGKPIAHVKGEAGATCASVFLGTSIDAISRNRNNELRRAYSTEYIADGVARQFAILPAQWFFPWRCLAVEYPVTQVVDRRPRERALGDITLGLRASIQWQLERSSPGG